jgi:TatD DNase family protein
MVSAGWFDTHCHVHDDRIPGGTALAVDDALGSDVAGMITIGCDRATSLAAIEVAANHSQVWATVGLHPHDAVNGVDTVADLLDSARVVAVGEAGLDYHYDHSPRDVQRHAFAAQIQLANARRLPLVIHTREAWADTFDLLAAEGVPERTIFHCFTGGPDEAERCLALGAYLSFSGIVTFKTATDVQAAAKITPIDRLLVETDAPYLAPVPHRGSPNKPGWVALVGRFVADLREQPVEVVAEATTANALAAFPGTAT